MTSRAFAMNDGEVSPRHSNRTRLRLRDRHGKQDSYIPKLDEVKDKRPRGRS